MKYIMQDLITDKVWRAKDESKNNNVQFLMVVELLNTINRLIFVLY